MFPSPMTLDDVRSWLYPYGRLRTSLASQGTDKTTDWNAFARQREDEQESASECRSTFHSAVTSPCGSASNGSALGRDAAPLSPLSPLGICPDVLPPRFAAWPRRTDTRPGSLTPNR